ncbi:MAG: DMT family transporter [Proteobacteria bacterium]|nr:DMT family transporter [Pseudomonadota bacterium]MDA1057801.1 DMT family transporter [Pseudomonadota bacterium]
MTDAAARAVTRTPGPAPVLLGSLAALGAVAIWGGWIVATRFGVTSSFSPVEIAILRTLPPGIILLPVLARLPWRKIRWSHAALMIAGAGAPYFLIVSAGTQFAPVADVGALLPGTMPLFAALFAFLLLGERLGRWRLVGFALIVAGGVAVGGASLLTGDPGAWRGHILFLAGAALWAAYTLALRQSGLGAWQATALVSAGSLIVMVPVVLIDGNVRFDASWTEIAIQIGAQGIGSGLLAMAAFGIAVRRLGGSNAAAFSALVPVLATLIAVPVLGELPGAVTWIGVGAVCGGVALASGVLRRLTSGRRAMV